MPLVPIDDLADPRLADYRGVSDPERLRRDGTFVAEGRLVVRTLLTAPRFAARSLLLTPTALTALMDVVEARLPGLPVFIAGQDAIQHLTGFNLHRGCLAIGERPAPRPVQAILGAGDGPATLVVLEHIVDADNVGAIFRNAAAFGATGVVLGPNCCDPLYRKSIRTSMGAALRVPFAAAGEWPGALRRLRDEGFTVLALTPRADARAMEDVVETVRNAAHAGPRRLAILAGSEGPGLSEDALAAADLAVRIPMADSVDSVNVATAVAIALHRLAGAGQA